MWLRRSRVAAIAVPLRTMQLADACWEALLGMSAVGNPAAKSDMQVGARALELGIWGASKNVEINMADITDREYARRTLGEAQRMCARAEDMCAKVLAAVEVPPARL